MKAISHSILALLLLLCLKTSAQQLTYTPVNPNFGGNYLNYSWLLSSANAQNPFDNEDSKTGFNASAISGFSDTIKRQILNQLTRSLFGDGNESGDGSDEGTFEIGGLIITIEDIRGGSVITIIDSETGESTEIIL